MLLVSKGRRNASATTKRDLRRHNIVPSASDCSYRHELSALAARPTRRERGYHSDWGGIDKGLR